LCDFSAEAGGEAFVALINTDEGARQLGEVALVGIDSPVFTCGLIFNEILLDENAGCHIALGSAYKSCIEDAQESSVEELRALGVNESKVHTDFMISNEGTDVDALTVQGKVVPIIRAGLFMQNTME
jgi:aminopeptidase